VDAFLSNFAQIIHTKRLSQQDLEQITGIAQSTISNLELGTRPARLSTIRKLAEALNLEPKELMKE
jgi:transcriptional regulator with XRE-family HTH domain